MNCCSNAQPEYVGGVIPVSWHSPWEKEEKEGADAACWRVSSDDDVHIPVPSALPVPNATPGGALGDSPVSCSSMRSPTDLEPKMLSPSVSTNSLPTLTTPSRAASKALKTRTMSSLFPDDDDEQIGSPGLNLRLSRVYEADEHEGLSRKGSIGSKQDQKARASGNNRRRLSLSGAVKFFAGGWRSDVEPATTEANPAPTSGTNHYGSHSLSSGSDPTLDTLMHELFAFCLAVCNMSASECAIFLSAWTDEEREALSKSVRKVPSREGVIKALATRAVGSQAVVWSEVAHKFITQSRMSMTRNSGSRLGAVVDRVPSDASALRAAHDASRALGSLQRTDTGVSNFSYTSCTDFNWRQQGGKPQASLLDHIFTSVAGRTVLKINGVAEYASSSQVNDDASEAALTYCSALDHGLWQSEAGDKQIVGFDVGVGGGQMAIKTSCLRTQNEWQRHALDNMTKRLHAVENDHAVEQEVQEEQKELLRSFRKVVTRETTLDADRPRVQVYIVEEDEQLRHDLEQLCLLVDYPFQSFGAVHEAEIAMANVKSIMTRTSTDSLSTTPTTPGSDWRFQPSAKRAPNKSAKESAAVKVVLLKHSCLEQKLPPEWKEDGWFVVLTSSTEDIEEVGRRLLAAGEADIRQQLRMRGVQEYMLHPLSLDGLQCVANEAFKRRYGDEYLLSKAIGRGGSGVVYKAMRLKDGEVFALKEINTRRLSKKAQQEVESELNILRQLDWPTLVFLVDAWVTSKDRLQYLLMPLLEGGSLLQIAEATLAGNSVHHTPQVLDWYSQTLHGLSYLHWRGVVHRDIKPGNLLLAGDQLSLAIGDLGSAGSLPGDGPHPTRNGHIQGGVCTPLYSSPESLQHDKHYAASDIWSLGATFFEVFTLQTLFPAGAAFDQIREMSLTFNINDTVTKAGVRTQGAEAQRALKERCQNTAQADRIAANEFYKEISSLLVVDHLKRPSASELASSERSMRRLEAVLAKTALQDPSKRKEHLTVFQSLLQDSKMALRR
mmetsp:Transcript_16556/g.38239  ORF Transcript_16556/g.38239 Transcript_16556/m.38239 type:complete len:1005 (-) Transcript_16556:171-3185(-)